MPAIAGMMIGTNLWHVAAEVSRERLLYPGPPVLFSPGAFADAC
jgi:hypothetical protein